MNSFTRTYHHVLLTRVDDGGNEKVLYPMNTPEDVVLRNIENSVISDKEMTTLMDIINGLNGIAFISDDHITSRTDIRVAGYLADARAVSTLAKKIGNSDLTGYGDGSVSGAVKLILDLIKSGAIGGGGTGGGSVSKTTVYTAALLADSWDGNTYVLHNEFIDTTCNVELHPDKLTTEEFNALAAAGIVYGELGNGTITIEATGEIPKIDIPIRIHVTKVMQEEEDTGLDPETWNAIDGRLREIETVLIGIDELYVDNGVPVVSYSTLNPILPTFETPETTVGQIEQFKERLSTVENKIKRLDQISVTNGTFVMDYTDTDTASMYALYSTTSGDTSADLTEVYSRLSVIENKVIDVKQIFVDAKNIATVTY